LIHSGSSSDYDVGNYVRKPVKNKIPKSNPPQSPLIRGEALKSPLIRGDLEGLDLYLGSKIVCCMPGQGEYCT
jgi:hypothetical protein